MEGQGQEDKKLNDLLKELSSIDQSMKFWDAIDSSIDILYVPGEPVSVIQDSFSEIVKSSSRLLLRLCYEILHFLLHFVLCLIYIKLKVTRSLLHFALCLIYIKLKVTRSLLHFALCLIYIKLKVTHSLLHFSICLVYLNLKLPTLRLISRLALNRRSISIIRLTHLSL
jgi:hypothetical protein